jgi:cytochrome c biogenesis protein CcmG/thiol:disulfide interchange protein DsbE
LLNTLGNPFLAVAFDDGGKLGQALEVSGVPMTIVVDAQGILRDRHVGALDAAVVARLRGKLQGAP